MLGSVKRERRWCTSRCATHRTKGSPRGTSTYQPANGSRITDPEQTPLFIANADWALALNGKHLAFVSAKDYAIWLLDMSP